MSSEHMRANAIVDAARAEMYNAEADVRETKMQRDEAAKAVEKAEKAEKRAKRQLTQTTKAAIKDRGAVYKTPEGEIVARTFTAGKAAAKEGKALKLTYDPLVHIQDAAHRNCLAATRGSGKKLNIKHDAVAKAKERHKRAEEALELAYEEAGELLKAGMDSMTLSADKERDFGTSLENLVAKMAPEDLTNLKLVFLDKSGSMGCNPNTYNALCLGACTALAPTEGACLLFLLAGPGETQVFFSRSDQASARRVNIKLGCCTWFNEPVWLTLKALAPVVEALVTAQGCITDGDDGAGPSFEPGKVPLQVVCITDGMDNCSSPLVDNLPALATTIGAIEGPATGKPVYLPLGTWQQSDVAAATKALKEGQVPVFLMWVALSDGARHLMGQAEPGKVAVVDATYSWDTPDAFAKPDAAAKQLAIGDRVKVPGPKNEDGSPPEPRSAVISALADGVANIVLEDDLSARRVAVSEFLQDEDDDEAELPAHDPNRVSRALALADAAITRTDEVMRKVDRKTGVCATKEGDEFLTENLPERLVGASQGLDVALIPEEPVSEDFIRGLLAAIGQGVSEFEKVAVVEDRTASYLLQRAIKAMLNERQWDKTPLSSTLEVVAKASGLGLTCSTHGPGRLARLLAPHEAMMTFLCERKVIEEYEIQMSGATPIELRPDWDREMTSARIGYRMRLEARPSLLAAKAVLDSQQSGLLGLCRRAHQASLELAGAAA